MKTLLLFFLTFPLLVFSQQSDSKKPLTPYADIDFENGKVKYTVGNAKLNFEYRLLPRMYDKRLLQIRFNNTNVPVNGQYMAESQKAIRNFVDTELVSMKPTLEQMDYIKLCALLIIWDNKLKAHAASELEKLAMSKDILVKKNAELVITLLESYKNR